MVSSFKSPVKGSQKKRETSVRDIYLDNLTPDGRIDLLTEGLIFF